LQVASLNFHLLLGMLAAEPGAQPSFGGSTVSVTRWWAGVDEAYYTENTQA